MVEDAEKCRYRIVSCDGVYCGDKNYTVIIEYIPASVLPFTSFREGDTYHISENRIHSYKG